MVPPLAEYFGRDRFVGTAGSVHTFAGSYTALTEITARPVVDKGDYYIDEYGVTYRRGSILHVERPALPQPSLADYKFPDLTTGDHYAHLDEWIDTHTGRFRIVQLGMLFFERTWGMRGLEEFFTDMYLHQDFVEELLNGLEEVCHGVIDHLLSNYGERIDAIGLSDDYGSQSSLLISPESWRHFIKPRIHRLVSHIRRGGKYAYLHSCGHIAPLIPDLVEIGVDMLQPVQPETMDIFELKKRFGSQICLVGGISTQELLPYGTPDRIRDQVKRCREEMGSGGGYIMAPAKPVLPGVPLENAIALIEAMQQNTFS
jgi:uroporphyrinogen decarboxylase